MAKSVRDTVIQYNQPIRPRLKRPFSETHITRNLRIQRLSMSGEKPDMENNPVAVAEKNAVDDSAEDEYIYRPNLPEAQLAFDKILRLVSRMLNEAADEHTLSADDAVIAGATNSILYHLKDESITVADKQAEVSDVVGVDVSSTSFQELQRLADKLVDYAAADEQTLHSDATTVNASTGGESHQSQPAVKYPDVESITADTLTANTYTGANIPPLDILVRTSGVERLSDFMLWQCHQETEVKFVDIFWPNFGLKHLMPIILEWQWRRRTETVQSSYWNDEAAGRPSSSESMSDWSKTD
jgi:hypothetical protein